MVVDLLFVQFQKQPTIFRQCLSDFAYRFVKFQKNNQLSCEIFRVISTNLQKAKQ